MYQRVRCLDIRSLEPSEAEGEFATIFTNSVLEHVPDVSGVLRACHQLLKPGGQLVASMPLIEMNRHLLLRSDRYAEFRRPSFSITISGPSRSGGPPCSAQASRRSRYART